MSLPTLKIKVVKSGIRAEFSSIDNTVKYIDTNGLFPTFFEPVPAVDYMDPRPVLNLIDSTINSLKP